MVPVPMVGIMIMADYREEFGLKHFSVGVGGNDCAAFEQRSFRQQI
jgi:hypothetical protein